MDVITKYLSALVGRMHDGKEAKRELIKLARKSPGEVTHFLERLPASEQRYIGITDDWTKRLTKHNSGGSYHTAKFIPWEIETVVGFNSKGKALAFESYLKSGSGFAFARKHF